jgi:hypothetical protein
MKRALERFIFWLWLRQVEPAPQTLETWAIEQFGEIQGAGVVNHTIDQEWRGQARGHVAPEYEDIYEIFHQ